MSLGIANVAGSVGRPLVLDAASIVRDRLEGAAQPGQAVAGQSNPTVAAEKTERRDAVQATPTTSKAVKVDLVTDDTVSGELPEYPVFGPDKFARVTAERSQEAAEARAADAAAMADEEVVVVAAAKEGQVRSDAPEAEPVAEPEGAGEGAPEVKGDVKSDAPAQTINGVTEHPAEANEARLTA